jgi:hypothetical protein
VAYDGPALATGTMDVRDLAPALLALGELCERSNKVLNGERANLTVHVRTGFKPGSFNIDLAVIQAFIDQAKAFLVGDGVTAALNLAGIIGLASAAGVSLLQLFRYLKGKPAVNATTLKDGSVRITFIDATMVVRQTIVVSGEVVKLYNDPAVRAAAKKVVAPLEREGIDVFQVKDEHGSVVDEITKADLPAFSEEVAQRRVTGSDLETVLQIVKPSFDERLKWVFSDGTTNFFADIEDDVFFAQVQNRQLRFGSGDLLRVVMHVESFINESGQISNIRTIREVLEHVQPPRQITLLEPDEDR